MLITEHNKEAHTMDWFILGIEPTKDKKAITAAYRQKLRVTNPEDDPEAFKALRSAYEEAMSLADKEEPEPSRDESPVGLWMEDIARTYDNLASRINPDCWKQLMSCAVCIGLDTRPLAEEALLKFLMKCYHLPKSVWKVLDETFEFSIRAEELYEIWPRDFIDNAVLSGINLDPVLDYVYFTPGISGKDCDAYIRLYFQSNQMPLDQIGPILDQMDALSERHPLGEALRYRFYIETGREQEGKDGFRQLALAYPDISLLRVSWAEFCLEDGSIEEAQRIASHVLEINPQYLAAKVIYAKCLASREQFHEAKEYAYDILSDASDDPGVTEQMAQLLKQWNEQLIQRRNARLEEAPEDIDNMIELAWCYIQTERIDDAAAIARKIDPNYEDAFAYHNLQGKLNYNMKDYAQGLYHLEIVEQILRDMPDDGNSKSHKRKARLPEMLQLQGSCLIQLGRTEEAKSKLHEAMTLAPEDKEVLMIMGKIMYNSGEYLEAIDVFQQLLRLSAHAWVAELLMALCLYRLRRDQEAFHAVNRALSVQSYDLSLYILKMQILVRNEIFEEVHQILNFLQESGAPQDISCDFIRAELTELEQKDIDSAMKQYRVLCRRVEAGEQLLYSGELYYHLAVLTGNQLDVSQEEDRNTVLQIVDKGLAADDKNSDLLYYKAWVLRKGGLKEDAIEIYQSILRYNPKAVGALRGIADLYYEDLNHNAAQALTYYEKLLDLQKTADIYFYAATCKRRLGELEDARIYYLKELEMDPDDIDGYRGLAFIAEAHGDHEKSLELLNQALVVMEECNSHYDWLIRHKVKMLRRLGRYEDALSYVAEAVERYQLEDALQLRFDICCQFGQWDRAKQVLDQWKRENRNDPNLMTAAAKLHMLQGKLFKASFAMGQVKHKLPARQIEDFRLQLNELECNHERRIQILSHRVEQNPADDHMVLNLAHALCHAGKTDAAQGAAIKALKLLDEKLSHDPKNEALYRSRRCLALAILGRSEEAKAELEKTRKLPLCDFCEYGSCKDADIYEAFIEEILGNNEQAVKLYTAGRTNWPDELDFAAGEARMKKKGRK